MITWGDVEMKNEFLKHSKELGAFLLKECEEAGMVAIFEQFNPKDYE